MGWKLRRTSCGPLVGAHPRKKLISSQNMAAWQRYCKLAVVCHGVKLQYYSSTSFKQPGPHLARCYEGGRKVVTRSDTSGMVVLGFPHLARDSDAVQYGLV